MTKKEFDEKMKSVFGFIAAQIKENGHCNMELALNLANTYLKDEIQFDPPQPEPDKVMIKVSTIKAILGEYSFYNLDAGVAFATHARFDLYEAITCRNDD